VDTKRRGLMRICEPRRRRRTKPKKRKEKWHAKEDPQSALFASPIY